MSQSYYNYNEPLLKIRTFKIIFLFINIVYHYDSQKLFKKMRLMLKLAL